MQKWEGIKEYKMVGGKILGTKFPVFFFFRCGSLIGDTFLSFSIKLPLTTTHRNNFLSNTSERDAVSLLGYSAVGYLFVPDCREVILCCGLSFHMSVRVAEFPFPRKTTLVLEV